MEWIWLLIIITMILLELLTLKLIFLPMVLTSMATLLIGMLFNYSVYTQILIFLISSIVLSFLFYLSLREC